MNKRVGRIRPADLAGCEGAQEAHLAEALAPGARAHRYLSDFLLF